MGVRGLTTYISKHADRYLEPYSLHDCSLVVDGNSLASNLYNWYSKCECAYGGDYDEYKNCVSIFFIALKKCGIRPLVIFDGGYETRKLGTVMRRLKVKIRLARDVRPMSSKNKFFPLLMKEVFKDVLMELNVAFAQCFFEADDEIAAIARSLGCPVLSYDSDFFVYDVLYIPFSTVHPEAVKAQDSGYEMSCSLYNVERFLNNFGGLTKSLIPLMATLLGNDYIKRSVFKNFYTNLKFDKRRSSNGTEKRIVALLAWLQHETITTAVEKILLTVKKQYRPRVIEQIRRNIKGYTQCSSELLPYLGISSEDTTEFVEVTNDVYPTIELCDVTEAEAYENECSDNSTNSSSEGTESEEDSAVQQTSVSVPPSNVCIDNLPKWFKDSFTIGNFPSYFVDMLTLHSYFCSPQIEDCDLPFSHIISLRIIGVIFGHLTSGSGAVLKYFGRNRRHQPERLSLLPLSLTFPPLSILCDLPPSERLSILRTTVEFNENDMQALNTFPAEWRLYITAIVYWGRHCMEPVLSNCHIHALVLSVIALSVVDKQAGYFRSKAAIRKALAGDVKNILESKKLERTDASATKPLYPCDVNVADALTAVTKENCVLLVNAFLPFHVLDPQLRGNSKLYSITTVHAYAQFQSVLFHLIHLNALLSFPLPQCRTGQFYSGTFVCNAYGNFKKRSDVNTYIETSILSCAPSVCALYKVMVKSILGMLPQLSVLRRKGKKKHNRSKCTLVVDVFKQGDGANRNEDVIKDTTSFEDLNNRFCALSNDSG